MGRNSGESVTIDKSIQAVKTWIESEPMGILSRDLKARTGLSEAALRSAIVALSYTTDLVQDCPENSAINNSYIGLYFLSVREKYIEALRQAHAKKWAHVGVMNRRGRIL
jgi:hypothetical protein